MRRIAFIGAGSLGFSRRLMIDILSCEALRDTEFALMDVNTTRLKYMDKIAGRGAGPWSPGGSQRRRPEQGQGRPRRDRGVLRRRGHSRGDGDSPLAGYRRRLLARQDPARCFRFLDGRVPPALGQDWGEPRWLNHGR